MTYETNDTNRRVTDEDYRSTTGAGAYTTRPRNTGVIGAIIGVLAVVAIIFFVWRGYESPSTTTGTSSPAATSTTAAPVRPAAPAAPATTPSGGAPAATPTSP
jgi:zona occludens toxin (predicted ATPase)